MNKMMRLFEKKIVRYSLICIASVYLTFIVDVYTLNTFLKRLFVFGYFFVICTLFVYLKKRFLSGSRSFSIRLLSTTVAVLLVVALQNTFIPTVRDSMVTLRAGGDGEVWMSALEVDGKAASLANVQVAGNTSWQYDAGPDVYVYYPDENLEENYLQLNVSCHDICLYFEKNDWSGTVYIEVEGQPEEQLNLHTEGAAEAESEYRCLIGEDYSWIERVLLNVGIFIVLLFCLETILKILFEKTELGRVLRKALLAERQKTKPIQLIHCFLAIVFLFMLCGQNLILDHCSVQNLFLFIVGLVPAYIFCILALYVLDVVCKNKKKSTEESELKSEKPISLRVLSSILAILWTVPTLVLIGNSFLLPCQAGQVQIQPLNQAGADSKSTEVWLLDVIIDGEHLDLQSLELPEGWRRSEGNKPVFIPFDDTQPEALTVPYPAGSHVYLKFLHHAWSGIVVIEDGEKSERIDLSDQKVSYYHEVTGNRGAITTGVVLLYCITGILLFLSFYVVIYFLYKKIFLSVNGYRQRSWIYLFLTAFSVFSFYFLLCRPGFLNKDATVQWSQALGLTTLTNSHPIVSTLFWRLCSNLVPSISFAVFVQYTIIAAILATCFMILIDHDIRRKHVMVLLAVLTILPNQALLAISATKDGLYCAFLLLMGVALYNIIYLQRKVAIAQFALSAAMVYLLRHEGIAVVLLAGTLLVILAFARKKLLPGILALAFAIMLATGTNSILSNLYLKDSGTSAGGGVFWHLIIGVHAEGGNIGPAGEKYLETFAGDIPLANLEAKFDPYNSDTIGWSEYHDQLTENKKELTKGDDIAALVDCLRYSPGLTIRLKLAEDNLLWNFFQNSTSWHDLGGWVYFPSLGDEFGFETLRGPCASTVQNIVYATQKNPVLNALLWRMGASTFVWMLLAVYALEKKSFRCMLISIPVMLQWAVLMMVLTFQVYRYLWITLMMVPFQMVFLVKFLRDKNAEEREYPPLSQ